MSSVLIRSLCPRRSHSAKVFLSMSSMSTSWENLNKENIRPHTPVMVEEVIEHLNLKEGDMFLDMTFGAGGHSEALLKKIPNLKVFALDRDPTALEFAKKLGEKYPDQMKILEGKFSDLPSLLDTFDIKQSSFNGILFDLGCSSMQLDNPERGFSLSKDGPLDMRMDAGKEKGLTAADIVAYADEKDLVKILKVYGGEKSAYKIAKSMVQARSAFRPLKTTKQLKDLVETVLEKEIRTDQLNRVVSSATKTFQALRIFVNNEINELNYGLLLAHRYLKPKGRIVVLSFHSTEDTVVKRQFNNMLVDNSDKPLSLVYFSDYKDYSEDEIKDFQPKNWTAVYKKVLVPSTEEVEINPRSRSAHLRVAEKIDNSAVNDYESDDIAQDRKRIGDQ